MDVFKSFGSKIFGKTMKKAAKTAATKANTTAATKTGEHVGKKAGDKIIEMLSKSNTPKKVTFEKLLQIILEKLLHLIGIIQDYLLILKLIN